MSDYGLLGRVGIGTPQANPTVEAEMAILLPRACTMHVTRLVCPASSPDDRLRAYLQGLDNFLAAYDTFRPDVFGFACTGSSYLLGAREEDRLTRTASERLGYPIVTSSHAIVWAMRRMNARRIAVISAYSPSIIQAASSYWGEQGIEVVRTHRVPLPGADTRGIYELASGRVEEALRVLPRDGIDAVLVSGTGLASLPALRDQDPGMPVVSSNVCLAARLLDLLGHGERLEAATPFIRGWKERLSEAQTR
jgi:maleate isomerase